MKKILLAILICHAISFCFAQNNKLQVSGKVFAEDSRTEMLGVSVKIKGTSTAVQTDAKGAFKMTVPAVPTVLVFTFLGYLPKEVNVSSSSPVVVYLAPSSNDLNEVTVVNVGFGTVTRERLAGSVSSIKAKDIADFPVTTAAEALAGKLAGVSVTTTEGAPGADINILVRGGTSITQSNTPLYIVDGVPLENALTIISPNEIEAIDVLKDMASTAIYGSKGSNGVVIITTKSGKRGRTIVSFDTYAGVRQITNYLEMLQPYDYVIQQYTQNMMHFNGGLSTDTAQINGFKRRYGEYPDLEIYKSFPAVDWQKAVFGRKAFSNTQILNLSGGTATSSFNFTANRADETGIMLNSGLERTLATFRFDNEISKTFKVGINLRYSAQKTIGGGTSFRGANGGLRNSARFQPYEGASNLEEFEEGALIENRIDLSTPVTAALRDQRINGNDDLITSAYLNINFSPNLTFRSNVGYRAGKNNNKYFRGVVQYENSLFSKFSVNMDNPFVDLVRGTNDSFNNSSTLNYRKTFAKEHRVEVLGGIEINKNDMTTYNQNIRWFPAAATWEQAFANIQQANPPNGAIQTPPTTDESGERTLSFFGRIMYSYKSKYSFNALIRRDGSSKFSPENQWSNFPSAQFAWRISEEEFFKDLNFKWLNGFKFRASLGTAGNNRVSNDRLYTTLFTTSPSGGGYSETDASQSSGIFSSHLANPNLKWETTVSQNLGLDLDFLNSRFTASIDVYSNKTNDLLLNTNIPQQNGYNQQFQNIGSTRNRGLEIQLSGQIAKTNNFTYSSSFNISFNRNEVLSLNQGGGATTYGYGVSTGWGVRDHDYYVQVGQPVGLFYGFVSDGFYTLNDFDRATSVPATSSWVLKPGVVNASNMLSQNVIPGVAKFKDLNGDGTITLDDRQIIGKYQPKFFGGFNNQFSYKGFDMSVFLNYSYGGQTYNANSIELGSRYQVSGNNFLAEYKDSWKYFDDNGVLFQTWEAVEEANKNTKIHAPTNGQPISRSAAIEDASFLRITNVTLGYSFPKKLLERFKYISRFRLYATVNNLYTFTKYSGFDPEASTRGSALTPGLDYSAYPRSRYMLAGINVSF
ncbi:MAG: TonB-dependent receptor [Flavobacteriales bacterium]|nr:MAG: TonB-dependent receptor [Flavobacteriales bacterium]